MDWFTSFTQPMTWLFLVLGTTLGIVVGAIPGLTGAMLISLTIPITFGMDAANAMTLLISMYVGAVSGGMISATLLRMPGTPAAMITTLDAYPMAQQGKPERALALGIGASLVGGTISWIILATVTGPLARASTALGPFEFSTLILAALMLTASIGSDSRARGLLAAAFGITLALPGLSPATGELRMTFGLDFLNNGLSLLPILIGFFAMSQALAPSADSIQAQPVHHIRFLQLAALAKGQFTNLVRSSIIGTGIGILPGIGANIGSAAAYSTAKRFSSDPDQFGNGASEGIIASESANNATVGGALIPLIALGIPGSVIDSILLGALTIHGLQPGPLLFEQHPETANLMIGTVLLANLVMFVVMIRGIPLLSKLNRIPKAILIPTILCSCIVGSYSLSNRMFDVWTMFLFGFVGIVLQRLRLPLSPVVIGFIMGPLLEEHLGAALMISEGSLQPFFARPIALAVLVSTAAVAAFPLFGSRRKKTQHTTN
jgi:putative tricarboxylic transport membrane protein